MLAKDMLEDEQAIDILAPVASTSDAPLVRYLNLLLNQAISDSASDIHVEPSENKSASASGSTAFSRRWPRRPRRSSPPSSRG